MTADAAPAAAPASSRSAIFGWCLYDWAMSAFNTVIGTFVFSVYFAKGIVGDADHGAALWGVVAGSAGIAIALLSPVLGAVADHGGRRKAWLATCVAVSVVPTALLWFMAPEPSSIVPAMLLVGIATIAFELSYVFYNALLIDVAPPGMLGRVSGWGWGLGYFGGLFCLVIALFGLIGFGGAAPLLPLPDVAQAGPRATGPLVALWWVVFALPLLLLVRERPGGAPIGTAIRRGLADLGRTLKSLPAQGNMVRFLVGSAIYREGFNVLFAFGGIYAAGALGLNFGQIVLFAIGLNVTSGIGAFLFAWVDDGIGSKPTILIAIVGLVAIGVPLILVTDPVWFIGLALVLGLFLGPAQAASRTLMGRLAPAGGEAEAYGLYGLTGRATGFVGPWLFAAATAVFASQRAGMAVVIALFAIGGLIVATVREPARG
ncbi:UMF1 family MFS transporter [Inquilinus ginsengisoli]|uniref:UMF1 family MFS transporter n=1 Tax=Inquilinus ginsengisoli TaxID=363840 RepID=A0ABU1JT16_9PROT|nr:MFS transporter [Inquilinus ginsengisoli]MDR6291766.1 UMF1 family MFS transporter [Inquilinus ginsengisoli]